MLLRHSRLIVASSALLLLLAPVAGAAVLWDQTNLHQQGEGSVNLSSTSCSPTSGNTKVHTASDVHFSQPVHITNIRIYEQVGNVQTATQAYLWIAPKTGPLPTTSSDLVNNAANIVPITITSQTIGVINAVVVSANGLNIDLPAGDYWISLTPRHSLGLFPYTVHYVTTGPIVGHATAAINACTVNSTWVNPLNPPTYDYSIKVEGDFPVPALHKSWASVKSIYR